MDCTLTEMERDNLETSAAGIGDEGQKVIKKPDYAVGAVSSVRCRQKDPE
jgi:hypothetical protein